MRFFGLLLLCVSLAACTLPRVHKITIQQGNVITQEMIDRLKPGMTRRQVAFIMGDPVLRNGFTPDRWDYVYTIQLPNQAIQTRYVSLFFEDEVLAYFTGDFAPTEARPAVANEAPDAGQAASADQTAATQAR